MDQELSRRPHIARKFAILAFCSFVAIGAVLFWLRNSEVEDDPQLVAALQGLHASGATIRAMAMSELMVPIPGAELLVPWLPDSVVSTLVKVSAQYHVVLDGDQVNDANLSHLRNLHDLSEVEITNATLTDDWIDYLNNASAEIVVQVTNCTAQSDSGRAYLAEMQQANAAFISQVAPAMIAPATDQANSTTKDQTRTFKPQVDSDE